MTQGTDYPPPAGETSRPPIVTQGSAELAPESPAEVLAFAVDTVISAWAYSLTATHGRTERRDAAQLFAAAMGALIDVRRAQREAAAE